MAHGRFSFEGTGGQYLWLVIWTSIVTSITFGIFGPWAFCAIQKWQLEHTTIDGQKLCFKGTGGSAFGLFLGVALLSIITLGIYAPWGYCKIQRWITANTYFADLGDVEN
jgi:uncharacterized membrane protein YjgN (DUF898 family)